MAKKSEPKVPKYQEGDILKSINPNSKTKSETAVILISRWDRTPSQRIAWLCQTYPDGEAQFAIPESELFPID
ncbi:hypothetical protein [Flavobacterium yafengii]|uniref:hypothetical protein n=1 Tax=Flavobacterium yafengii TaxID=3041253 RepID=UPI0024A8F44D|nr:hypothetical protein [Flavobacterium yafengii]MDI5886239.1 hypothetical protein [Flavobacterium yafengii]